MADRKKIQLDLAEGKKAYFFSDVHLGIDTSGGTSAQRERKLIECLDMVAGDAGAIFMVGDLFDFWFEYRHAVPKGFVRILSKLAALDEKGIAVYAFTGNHDLWMKGYFEEELNIPVYYDPIHLHIGNKHILVGHGDGLGPGDHLYKLLKKIFRSSFCRWLFSWLHPDIGIKIARLWSDSSRNDPGAETFKGEKEWLLQYARKKRKQYPFDYFIFGHRHLPLDIALEEGGKYLNIGDWMVNFTYIEYDGNEAILRYYS